MLDEDFPGVYTDVMKKPFYMTLEEYCEWAPICLLAGMFLLGLCLPGCSAAGEGEEYRIKTSRCLTEDTFSPGPSELADAVLRSAQLWEAAIGRPVCVEEGGLPIELSPVVLSENNEQACGFTWQYWHKSPPPRWAWNKSIEIRQHGDGLNCYSYDQVVLHEMGHALGHRKDHTDFGLMVTKATPEEVIDQSAIDYVCRDTECH